MTPIIVDKEKKKTEILKAAFSIFASKGYYKAKMSDIAEEAKIGRGTIYEYFKTKEDLFVNLFLNMMEEVDINHTSEISTDADPARKLELLFERSTDSYKSSETIHLILMEFLSEVRRGKMEEKYNLKFKEMYSRYREKVGAIIKEGIKTGLFKKADPEACAAIIIAVIEGLMFQWMSDPASFDYSKIREAFTTTLIDGLKSK